MAATLVALWTSPRSPASIAAMVWRLGTRTSNGRAFSAATRVSNMRTASDTVNPIAANVFAAFAFTFSSTRIWTMLVAIKTHPFDTYTLYTQLRNVRWAGPNPPLPRLAFKRRTRTWGTRLRNAVRLTSGIDVHLHRNTHCLQRNAIVSSTRCSTTRVRA